MGIKFTDYNIFIELPQKRCRGRGRFAYLLYALSDSTTTWEVVSCMMNMADNRAWESARRWAVKSGWPWPIKRVS